MRVSLRRPLRTLASAPIPSPGVVEVEPAAAPRLNQLAGAAMACVLTVCAWLQWFVAWLLARPASAFASAAASYWPAALGGCGGHGRGGGSGGGTTLALTHDQRAVLDELRRQVDAASHGEENASSSSSSSSGVGRGGLAARAAACGLPLVDGQLVRYLTTSEWALAYPDGNTVLASLENTVAWREETRLWARAASGGGGGGGDHPGAAAAKERIARCGEALGAKGLIVVQHLDLEGRPVVVARPRLVEKVEGHCPKLDGVPDLLLLTLERAERLSAAARSGGGGGGDPGAVGRGVAIYVDCAGCSLNALRRLASAALPVFWVTATHYPHRLAKVRVLHASRAVRLVYRIALQPFMTPAAQAQVAFVAPGDVEAACTAEVGPEVFRLMFRDLVAPEVYLGSDF